MIACCGLDCSKCEAYLATQEDNDVKRALGSHKNNFTFYASRIQASFARSSTPKSSK
ncbi:MAG: DUF3795 domain-containing protein [Deltaproteobacteria bacterium]|nr:DUF3795 domain-containing protein [Deltaproteobacteria bacterium]